MEDSEGNGSVPRLGDHCSQKSSDEHLNQGQWQWERKGVNVIYL